MEGKLVRLRAFERSDLDSTMKWINDEEVTDFLAGGNSRGSEEAKPPLVQMDDMP